MKKTSKIIATSLLILLILSPILFFIIYPNINSILLTINSFNIYNISSKNSINILSKISPPKDTYNSRVLGYTSIEESLSQHSIVLEEKILEESDTILVIDELNIQGEILQGESSLRMDDGFWHFPTSAFPGQKGNAVIIGHRFMHFPPRKDTFFNLDKSKVGQSIVIKDNYGTYNYTVMAIKEVEPNDLTAIEQTEDYRLTLITCTPLWTSEKRLLVIAKLDKLYKKV